MKQTKTNSMLSIVWPEDVDDMAKLRFHDAVGLLLAAEKRARGKYFGYSWTTEYSERTWTTKGDKQ